MKDFLGWPVVTAQNCFDIIRECGIKPWPKIQEPELIDSYFLHATQEQKDEYNRFGPKSVVVVHQNPSNQQPFNGFRSIYKPYAMIFALINEMVPVTAEWKHGNNRVTIVPVAGVPGKQEASLPTLADQMRATAFREWSEETGTELTSVIPLGPSEGLFSEARKMDSRYFPFLGEVKDPIVKGPTKFDENETLQMVLFPLREWVKLIETPELWDKAPEFGLEACTRDGTYAALRKLGKLQFA